MSMYLFDDTPIVVNTTLANEIGLNGSDSTSTNKLLDRDK